LRNLATFLLFREDQEEWSNGFQGFTAASLWRRIPNFPDFSPAKSRNEQQNHQTEEKLIIHDSSAIMKFPIFRASPTSRNINHVSDSTFRFCNQTHSRTSAQKLMPPVFFSERQSMLIALPAARIGTT
jgi:hypothetical protein